MPPASKRSSSRSISRSGNEATAWWWRHLWIACVFVGVVVMGVTLVSMRLAFATSSAWCAVSQTVIALPYSFMTNHLWSLAFPDILLGRWWLPIGFAWGLFSSIEISDQNPNPASLPLYLIKLAEIVSYFCLWGGLILLPAWRTRSRWWHGRSRGMFRLAIAYVALCVAAQLADAAGYTIVCNVFFAFMFLSMLVTMWFCFCDSKPLGATSDGGYLLFLCVVTAGWPTISYIFLSVVGEMKDRASVFVLVLWVFVNSLFYAFIVRCSERAIGSRIIALALFPFLLASDIMLALIFLDTQLTDGIFWLSLSIEAIWKVAREAGLVNALSDWLRYRQCQLFGRATHLIGDGIQLSSVRVEGSSSIAASATRQRIAMEFEVREMISVLGCASEVLASVGLFLMLLLDYALGGNPVLVPSSEAEQRGAIYCYAVLVLSDIVAIGAVRWVKRTWSIDDAPSEPWKVEQYCQTHHVYMLCSAVLVSSQCIYYVARLNKTDVDDV